MAHAIPLLAANNVGNYVFTARPSVHGMSFITNVSRSVNPLYQEQFTLVPH